MLKDSHPDYPYVKEHLEKVCVYVYVRTYMCMCVLYDCTVRVYECMYECMHGCTYVRVYVWVYGKGTCMLLN